MATSLQAEGATVSGIDLSAYRAGFCDRLRLVTWGIAVALRRGQSQLLVKDEVNRLCPYLLDDLIEIQGLEIVPWHQGRADVSPSPFTRSNVFPGKSSHAAGVLPPDLGLSAHAFQSLWLEAYTRLRPKAAIQEMVESLELGWSCLGLHVRTTDKIRKSARGWMEIEAGQLPLLEATTFRLLHKRNVAALFLACDDAEQKARWERLLRQQGFQVRCHPAQFDSSQLRQTGGHDFAVDLFALAACGQVLGTTRSGVVHTADWISGRRRSYFAVDGMLWPLLWRQLRRRLVKTF